MAHPRISTEKRAMALDLLCEGTGVNAVCRLLKIGKPNLLRFVLEVAEACEDWHDKHFRGLSVRRLELDEQWAWVGKHKERMTREEKMANPGFGDVWLWASLDQQERGMLKTYLRDFRKLTREEITEAMYGVGNYHEVRVKAGEMALAELASDKRDAREEATLGLVREANDHAKAANSLSLSANAASGTSNSIANTANSIALASTTLASDANRLAARANLIAFIAIIVAMIAVAAAIISAVRDTYEIRELRERLDAK